MNTPTESEPTADDLNAAWTVAITAENIAGWRSEAREHLAKLREAKFTWFGSSELRLRDAIDRYLRGELP